MSSFSRNFPHSLPAFPSVRDLSAALLSHPSHCISQLLFILAADFLERKDFNIESRFAKLTQEVELLSARLSSLEKTNSLDHEQFESDVHDLHADLSPLLPPVPTSPLGSLVISDFPAIFEEFRGSTFNLLYRGSRDGFHSGDFFMRCAGHSNTLTAVKTTEGCVFGGFTPVMWQVSNVRGRILSDESRRSFIFTLVNPFGTPPMRFPLKEGEHNNAILVCSAWGPSFGGNGYGNSDFRIASQCHGSLDSFSELGRSYENNSGYPGSQFLTGARFFTVAEIEVFEIVTE
jgi:hypothetical protein